MFSSETLLKVARETAKQQAAMILYLLVALELALFVETVRHGNPPLVVGMPCLKARCVPKCGLLISGRLANHN